MVRMRPTVTTDRIEELIRYRRQIHKHPELRYEENQTAGYVIDHLKSLGSLFRIKSRKPESYP